MLRAGIDDWGGVSPLTPDHVNPERPWPQIDELAARTAAAGFALRGAADRSTPSTCWRGEPWLDPRLQRARRGAGRPGDRARPARTRCPSGRPWQEPDGGFAAVRADRPAHRRSTPTGRTDDRREDFDDVYGDWDALRERLLRHRRSRLSTADVAAGAAAARRATRPG